MNCPKCHLTLVKDNECSCGWKDIPKGAMCSCGNYARIEHFGEMMCWSCRSKSLRGHPLEDWRDQIAREYCKQNNIHKYTREEMVKFMKDRGFPCNA